MTTVKAVEGKDVHENRQDQEGNKEGLSACGTNRDLLAVEMKKDSLREYAAYCILRTSYEMFVSAGP
jgi:hypothetical protein